MIRIAVLTAYSALGIVFLATVVRARVRGRDVLGRPSLHPLIYYPGKLALFGAMIFPLLQTSGVRVGWTAVPPWLAWTSLGLLLAGTALMAGALLALGAQTKMGLGKDTESLQTGGLYRFSRNPMYLGAFLMCGAGCLSTLHPACAALSVLAAVVHHGIVRAEERFLKERFGDEWDRYAARARRYL